MEPFNQIDNSLRALLRNQATAQGQWELLAAVYRGLGLAWQGAEGWRDVMDAKTREGLRGAFLEALQVPAEFVGGLAADHGLEMLGTASKAAIVKVGDESSLRHLKAVADYDAEDDDTRETLRACREAHDKLRARLR